jgi:hypothetical protein
MKLNTDPFPIGMV